MITPAFDISQDSDFLIITIKVPYARVSEFDIYIEGEDFKFFAKPYFLRLTLPGRIVEDGRQKATYNADDGVFTVRVAKETPGQRFEGLNLLTSLLAPKGAKPSKRLIEEIGASGEVAEDEGSDEDFDWQMEQTPYEEPPCSLLRSQCTYGFGNLSVGVFERLQEELNDVIDLRDPDVTPAPERTQRRLLAENHKFDPDHYLADLFEDDAIQHLLQYTPWWARSGAQDDEEARVTFTDGEKEQLRRFTTKSYVLDKRSEQRLYLGLVDLLLAYCYEVRVTEGERNVESAWNVRKLSGTLSWFESYASIAEVLVTFGRRVLCYPLYRHFCLVTKAIEDTRSLLRLGKAAALKCLLDVHSIFQANDPAYVLNDLYISDYCVWIQRVRSRKVSALCDALDSAVLCKADLGLELEELEEAANMVQAEENQQRESPRAAPALIPSETSSSSSSQDTSSEEEEDGGSAEEEVRSPSQPPSAPLIQMLEDAAAADSLCAQMSVTAVTDENGPDTIPGHFTDGTAQSHDGGDSGADPSHAGGDSGADPSHDGGDSGADPSHDGGDSGATSDPPQRSASPPRVFLEVTPRDRPLLIVSPLPSSQ